MLTRFEPIRPIRVRGVHIRDPGGDRISGDRGSGDFSGCFRRAIHACRDAGRRHHRTLVCRPADQRRPASTCARDRRRRRATARRDPRVRRGSAAHRPCAPAPSTTQPALSVDVGSEPNCGAAETVLICVPTPVDDHLVPDLRALEGAYAPRSSRRRAGRPSSRPRPAARAPPATCRPPARRAGPGRAAGRVRGGTALSERIDPGNAARTRRDTTPRVIGGEPECTGARRTCCWRTGALGCTRSFAGGGGDDQAPENTLPGGEHRPGQ